MQYQASAATIQDVSTMGRAGLTLFALALGGVAAMSFLALLISPLVIAIGKDDWSLRLPFLAIAALIGSGVGLTWVLRAGGPRDRMRTGRRWWAVAILVAFGCVAWAAIGIDSTRAVRDLPESGVAFPGSIETDRSLAPSTRGFGHHGATLTRSYHTAAPYGEVVAFYLRELRARGWTGGDDCGARSPYRSRMCTFYRADFTIQVELPTSNLAESGSFVTVIGGPP